MSALEAEVIIAGGGPVGSLAAYLLAAAGVEVLLVDENVVPIEDYRASTFHPPTLDLLEPHGVTDALVAMGLQCPVIQYRDRMTGPVAELDLGVLAYDTGHPYRLQCEQFKLTDWLQRRLATMPTATLLLGHSVAGVQVRPGGVDLTVADRGSERTLRSRYLIACDGGRSVIRRQLGIDFAGYTHPEQFLVAGVQSDFKARMDVQSINYTSDPDEWFLLLQIPDMWRIVLPVAEHVSRDDAASDERIQRSLQNICPSIEPYEILVRSVYRVHQRVAQRYRSGSVFLAGDAAHVNNPLGGMGLNGGIHDALVLCEQLVDVLRRGADPITLDDYERLRRPVAINDINAATERNKQRMEERDVAVRAAHNAQLRADCADPQRAYALALEVSMIRSLRSVGLIPPTYGGDAHLPERLLT